MSATAALGERRRHYRQVIEGSHTAHMTILRTAGGHYVVESEGYETTGIDANSCLATLAAWVEDEADDHRVRSDERAVRKVARLTAVAAWLRGFNFSGVTP